jgi:hypothetical protein
MFKVLIPQSSHSLSDERTEYLIKGRLSLVRFLVLSFAQSAPDANSIWNFREALRPPRSLSHTVVNGISAEALGRPNVRRNTVRFVRLP